MLQATTYHLSRCSPRSMSSYGITMSHHDTLTHWGRVTHICVSKLTIIGSDNGSSPDRYQAIIWTNAWILLIGPLGTNFSEILIKILTFSFKKMRLKVSSATRWPFCLDLNVLNTGFTFHYKDAVLSGQESPWWSNNLLISFTRRIAYFYWNLPRAIGVSHAPFALHIRQK